MERGSDKHGPILDDQLGQEVEPLTRGAPTSPRGKESREAEPAGEDQPNPDSRIASAASEDAPDPDEIEARSDLARFLRPSAFPADKASLIETARDEAAPEGIIAQLGRLPEGTEYGTVQEVWEALTHRETDPPRA